MTLWTRPDPDAVDRERRRALAMSQRISQYRRAEDQARRAQAARTAAAPPPAAVDPVISRINRWVDQAPWLPPGVLLGAAETGVEPDSAAGRLMSAHHLATRGTAENWTTRTTGAAATSPARPRTGSAAMPGGRPWESGVLGQQNPRAAGRPVADRDVAQEWDDISDDEFNSAMQLLTETYGWTDAQANSAVRFARDNGIAPADVAKQVLRDSDADVAYSPTEFIREATKDRPGFWSQARNRVAGLIGGTVDRYNPGSTWGQATAPVREPFDAARGELGEILSRDPSITAGTPLDQAGVGPTSLADLTRPAFIALDAGMQGVQSSFRHALDDPLGALTPDSDGADIRVGGVGRSIAGETDLGIVLEQVAQGEPVDLGDGFFPNTWDPTSQVGAIRYQREATHGQIGGHNITMGRWLADRVFEPDTVPFNIVSGLTDASVAIVNPLDMGVDKAWDATRGYRAVTNWRAVDEVAANPVYRQAEDILSGRLADTEHAGVGVHATLESYLRLPREQQQALRAGREFEAPGVFGAMSIAERRLFAEWGDELEAAFPDRVTRSPWISAIDEDQGDELLEAGGGIRARAEGRTAATGTFAQASLDEAAAARYEAGLRMEPGAVIDLPPHQMTLDEFARSPYAVAEHLDDAMEDLATRHRRIVEDAIDRGDPVPTATLFDHPDLVPPGRLREIVAVDAGLVENAWRPDIVRDRFDGWLSTKMGANTLATLAEVTDVHTVWRLFDRRIPISIARQIADITDPELVGAVLRRHVGVEIRDLPTTSSFTGAPRLSGMDRAADALAGAATPNTFGGRARLAAARQLSHMPQSVIDIENIDDAVGIIERWMVNAAMPRERISSVIDQVARARHPEDLFPIVETQLADALNDVLVDMGIPRERAKQMSRMYTDRVAGDRQWAVSPDGRDFEVPEVLMPDGTFTTAPGPMLASELVNRYIPLPADPRDIRRALSPFRRILDNPAADVPLGVMLALQQDIWKPLTLLRPAWAVRVVGEEQIRLAAGGLDSLFRHPLSYFAILAQRKLDESVLSEPLTLLGEHADAMSKGGGNAGDAGRLLADNTVRVGGFVKLNRNNDGYIPAWANELATLAHDPLARQVHNYGVNDETLEWFMRGGGADYREEMMASMPALSDPEAARTYLGTVAERIAHATAADPDLEMILRTGRLPGPDGVPDLARNARVRVEGFERIGKVLDVDGDSVTVRHVLDDGDVVETVHDLGEVTVVGSKKSLTLGDGDVGLNPEFTKLLSSRANTGVGPAWVVGEDVRYVNSVKERGRHWVDTLFQWFGSNPTNNFSRSPAFRQFYWRRQMELIPYMDETSRTAALAKAREQGVSRGQIADLRGQIRQTPPGELNLAATDRLSRLAALEDTKRLLFDMTERRQFFDTFRLLFPFGDAWSEVITRWARLAKENPLVARRLEQGITTGRSEGWFEEGAFGDEVFNYGPLSWAFSNLAPVDMQGRLSGLNMMGDVYPGFGFAVQVPAAMVWGDRADRQGWLEFFAPYGVGETIQATMLPPHIRRFAAGFLAAEEGWGQASWASWVPDEFISGLTGLGDYLGVNDVTRFENMRKDIMDHLVATGDWPTSTDAEIEALRAEAGQRASVFLMAHGVTQSVVPTVPIPDWKVETDVGLASKAQILDEWYTAQAEDPDTALQTMLDRYGENMWLIFQGKTRGVSLAAPITATPLRWVRENPHVVDRYPSVYGLFAPTPDEPEDIDPQAFDFVMRTGGREPLDSQQMIWLAQDRLAWSIYMGERDQFGERLAPNEAAYMQAMEEWLLDTYPGFQRAAGVTQRSTVNQQIRELELALADDAIRSTPAGEGLAVFLEGWNEAVELGREVSSADIPFASSAQTAHLRAYVRDHAEWTISEHPEFEPIWRSVFERAIRPVDEEQ